MTEPKIAQTWEECALHVDAGGVVMCGRVGDPGWDIDPGDRYTHLSRDDAPGRGGYLSRRLVPTAAPAPESSPDGEGQVVRRTRAEITDDFEEGTRTIRKWIAHGAVNGRHLCEELDAWLWYWGGAADGSSPVGSDPLSKVAAERDALAARLAAWPEVPDGHEVLVVPEWVSDEVAEWAGCNHLEGALADAGSAAVDRRPKPEPRVERVDALHAILNCLRVTNPDGPFSAVVAKWHEGCLVVADDATEVSRCQFIAPDGTVEVLAEDGES